ncbi:MAG: DUF4174 domain-containing protein [Saprospiraceae bacterium]|nr:DUF4174 domain-containing protein [Saprospiraceae bacterium]
MKYLLVLSFTILAHCVWAQNNPFRRIYLFAPSAEDTALVKQQQLLAAATERVNERDLRSRVFVAAAENNRMFKKFKVDPKKYTFLLIGKDGREKFRATQVVTPQLLFTIVDAMPMRQEEMRRRRQSPD